jgi:hypothetical protein
MHITMSVFKTRLVEACTAQERARVAWDSIGSAQHHDLHVQRANIVKIKAQDADGKSVRFTIEGWAARIFQHEFDHLQGVLFPDRISKEQLEREKEKLQALERSFVAERGPVQIQSVLDRLAA